MTHDTETQRREIRREVRAQRRGLSAREHQHLSHALCEQIARSSLFRNSRHIALYLPNDGEPDLSPLIERIWAMGKHCYLPVLSPLFHNKLWFTYYEPDTRLETNRFGIPEPAHGRLRPTFSLDLLLMPLVAFDGAGNRLGMGGGYYDRSLAYLARRHAWRKPRLIGTAFEMQRHTALPYQPWDVPLDGVATEASLAMFRQ